MARELTELGAHVLERGDGVVRFRYAGPWQMLAGLRVVGSVEVVVAANLPRPSAALDDGVFRRLSAVVRRARSTNRAGAFKSFRVHAAGRDSAVLRRFRQRLAMETRLQEHPGGADLSVRLRPVDSSGFELSARITPRPLSARDWRVCDRPDALNGPVASVMALLTRPRPDDQWVNLCCGSASITIERARRGPWSAGVACDIDPGALTCAARNLAAAVVDTVQVVRGDVAKLPLPSGWATSLTADLPFGHRPSPRRPRAFETELLAETARIARSGARFVVLTTRRAALDAGLEAARAWTLEERIQVDLAANAQATRPEILVLRRM
ncbi:MAG: methyltransferase domain-containing protein [Chloroflexota bacterium]